jgi:hypothetical protein
VGATASLAQTTLAVDPGAEVSVTVDVRNNGSVVDQFSIEVIGDGGAWATADPPGLSLFPGAQGTSTITFRPPRGPSATAGPVPFGVMVRSQEDQAGSTVEEGSLQVGAFLAPSAELIPRTSHGSRTGRHDLAVDNRGNVRMDTAFEGLDPDRLVRFSFEPPNLSIEPGVAGFTRVLVRPVRRFWRGGAKTRSFQVAVRPDAPDALPVVLDGTYLQESILPPWFMRALVALLALLIGAILLWLLVLQPQIKSTAAQTLADFGFSPKPGSSAAGGGGGGQPSPSPTPAAVPTSAITITPPPSGQQSLVDGRLDTTANALTPAAGSLFITDLVFSNPTGASGDLTLQRTSGNATTQLLVLRLDNFRDLDFHFVTPIVVHTGDTLALVANCSSVAGPTPPPACSPAVFYSGYVQGP